jgi:hypothetical protein
MLCALLPKTVNAPIQSGCCTCTTVQGLSGSRAAALAKYIEKYEEARAESVGRELAAPQADHDPLGALGAGRILSTTAPSPSILTTPRVGSPALSL